MLLVSIFYSCLFFLTSNTYADIKWPIILITNDKPLVLQWEVSHPRNTDQISLIFKQNHVELVTNTPSYQKGRRVRLGHFKTTITPELQFLKEQVKQYYIQLKKNIPISSLIVKDSRILPQVNPHAPVLRINDKKIHRKNPYFKLAAKIIYQAWDHKWMCVHCASYKKKKSTIVRTVRKLKSGLKKQVGKKMKKQWVEIQYSFVKKIMNCVPKGKKKEECVDPQFGIFEI